MPTAGPHDALGPVLALGGCEITCISGCAPEVAYLHDVTHKERKYKWFVIAANRIGTLKMI